jgi:hypothetical protein
MKKPVPDKFWMNSTEVCETLELSQTLLAKWRKKDNSPLRYKRVGRFFMYNRDSVEEYRKSQLAFSHGCQLFRAETRVNIKNMLEEAARCEKFLECRHQSDCLAVLFRKNWPGFTADLKGFEPWTAEEKKQQHIQDLFCRNYSEGERFYLNL